MIVSEFGNLNIVNKIVNVYLKVYYLVFYNFIFEFLNVIFNFIEVLVNVSLIFRNFIYNVIEYFFNIIYFVLFKINEEIFKNIFGFVNSFLFIGGVVYFIFMNFIEVWSISMIYFMYEYIDKNCYYNILFVLMIFLL